MAILCVKITHILGILFAYFPTKILAFVKNSGKYVMKLQNLVVDKMQCFEDEKGCHVADVSDILMTR